MYRRWAIDALNPCKQLLAGGMSKFPSGINLIPSTFTPTTPPPPSPFTRPVLPNGGETVFGLEARTVWSPVAVRSGYRASA